MRKATFLALLMAATTVITTPASAQLRVNHYRPAETANDGFVISRPNDQGGAFGFKLDVDYANDPLVIEQTLGDQDSELDEDAGDVVGTQITAHLGLSLGLGDMLVVFAGLPIDIAMSGSEDLPAGVEAADGFGIGDINVGARFRLVGTNQDAASVALQAAATIPIGGGYHGDEGLTLHPEALVELRGGVRFAANLGVRLRFSDGDITGLDPVSHEFTFGVGVAVPIISEAHRCYPTDDAGNPMYQVDGEGFAIDAEGDRIDCGPGNDRLTAHIDAWGSTNLDDFGDRETTPVEVLAGLRYRTSGGLSFGVAAGTGLNRGYGAPDFRAALNVGLGGGDPAPTAVQPMTTVTEPEPEPEAPAAAVDSDGDGLPDDADQCPNEPEDADGFEDDNGCPDADNDGDGVPDASDAAPMQPEDRDGFNDEDGAPDPDNDQDGIPDESDAAPNEAEDRDGFNDGDGAPDPDNDQDSIADADDRCPLVPGVANTEDAAANGCPANVRMNLQQGTITSASAVAFRRNNALGNGADDILNEVAATLVANPQIALVRVESHTSGRGPDARNMTKSKARAEAMVTYLTEHGVDASRLQAWGCGEAVAQGENPAERVEFYVLNPAPSSGVRNTGDSCQPVNPAHAAPAAAAAAAPAAAEAAAAAAPAAAEAAAAAAE